MQILDVNFTNKPHQPLVPIYLDIYQTPLDIISEVAQCIGDHEYISYISHVRPFQLLVSRSSILDKMKIKFQPCRPIYTILIAKKNVL